MKDYPFNTQTLPVTLEMISDSVQQKPSSLLCYLERYSGFAPQLSSFSPTFPTRTISADFNVGEAYNWPPFSEENKRSWMDSKKSPPQLAYPRAKGEAATLTHGSSRLQIAIRYSRTYALGVRYIFIELEKVKL